MEKKFDIVLWGASSFAGEIAAKYIAKQYGNRPTGLKWAIAGRNLKKLESIKTKLIQTSADVKNLDILIADSADYNSLTKLVKQTKVVISTVGPFMIYGEWLFKSCVDEGVDYVDLTGEAVFVRTMQDKYADKAKLTGSRLVSCCGVDSIPSDLGVYFTNQQSLQLFNEPIRSARTYVKSFKGAFSGGTVDSIINMLDHSRGNREILEINTNPYALCPTGKQSGIKQPKQANYNYDQEVQKWTAPFLMATINSKVVHRTNALLNYPYGKDFIYIEKTLAKNRFKALMAYLSLGLLFKLLDMKFTRRFMTKFVLPKSGEGPTIAQQEKGYFVYNIYGKTKSNKTIVTKVTGNKDPGYGSSAQMLAEAGICLALDINKNQLPGGCWSPASAFADHLYRRLKQNAGVDFEVIKA